MKRYLLFVIAFVCVSIGAWAQPTPPFVMDEGDIKYWCFNNDPSLGVEKVILIKVNEANGLKPALEDLSKVLGVTPPHLRSYRDALNTPVNAFNTTFDNFIADRKLVLKIVNNTGSTLTLSNDDLAALASIDVPTIDLQDFDSDPFTFVNSNVKRVILPDGWDKADVNAFGEALKTSTNFESAYSINATNGSAYTLDDNHGSIVAYVNKPGTLFAAMRHIYYDGSTDQVSNTKLGSANRSTFGVGKLAYLTLLGNPSARDFNGGTSANLKFDSEGHLEFDREADETSMSRNAGIGGTRQLVGTPMDGAIVGAQLAYLDLGDAIITDEHCSDLTLCWSYSAQSTTFKRIIFPTTPLLKTLPADCLNNDFALLEEFCIPGNIEVLKTRCCWISTQVVRHIWTTGTKSGVLYDNGAYLVNYDKDDPEKNAPGTLDHTGYAPLSSTVWNSGCGNNGIPDVPRFGTITLPENLKLIESHCFTSRNISDVYSLNPVAPECHVDAFSTIMYLGNNTIDTQYIKDMGMVTREAYAQSVSKGEYISFLHYPPTIGTPEIQRYTDPTREFSVATTLRDGKGNIIYFPNQSELNRAYIQGTTGYLWYAWDSERVPEPAGNANSFKNANPETSGGHTTQLQQTANNLYIANQMTNPDKTDRSFYDVRLDGDDQTTLAQPDGLKWYYNTRWEGVQLYPQAKYETSDYVYVRDAEGDYVKDPSSTCPTVFRAYTGSADDQLERYSRKQVPQTDGQGNIIYDVCTGGKYVQDYEWARDDAEGNFVKENVQSGYSATQTLVDGVDTYYSDATGTTAVTPQVGEGMYVECGTDNDYSLIQTNNPIDSYDAFYTSSGTPTNLPFNKTLYVKTGEQPKYTATTKLKYGVAHYYDANGQEVVPGLAYDNPSAGTIYYLDSENVRHDITDMTFVSGEGNYYFEYTYGGSAAVNDNYPSVNLDGTYYYEDGVENTYGQEPNGYYVSGTTYYNYDSGNNTYSEYTVSWNDITNAYNGVYYYVSGSHPAYCDAEGVEYDANKTYYSDQNGTVATTITLNDNYYIPAYVEVYREKTTGDVAPFYSKSYLGTYHLATPAEAGETPRYCTRDVDYVSETPITYSIAPDYRGWHQFVLAAYGPAGNPEEETVVKFYQTDNDWWTVCLPYDLTYSDMIQFFGNGPSNIPYLSKLRYVVRDYDLQKITLMFSKNLMVYKEDVADGKVHGVIDDETTWPETKGGFPIGTEGYDPVILHKGVPYLIRPNIDVNASRSFTVYKSQNADLYQRLVDAENVDGGALETYIYQGEYTVPAYVVGTTTEGITDSRLLTDYSYSNTYTSSDEIMYRGQTITAPVSSVYSYTFVGSFFLSVLPQYCYFLGWDSKRNCAAFWYNVTPKLDDYEWNNQTGVICANFNNATLIHKATGLNDPARWKFTAVSSDDLVGVSSAGAPKKYDMSYGGSINMAIDDPENPLAEDFGNQEVLSIDEIQSLDAKSVWYNVSGQKLNGRPTQSGVYIMNGKKYVVK